MQPANTLQTLDRGLQALTLIAQHEDGLSVGTLAELLCVHRAISYRLVATLEVHGLVVRGSDGQTRLGTGLLVLAARFEPHLRSVAKPLLYDLVQQTGAASFLSVPNGKECVAIMVAEPEKGVLRLSYRVGSRHPLTVGAAGIAILAGRPEQPGDTDAVHAARRDGYSVTHGQIQPGAVGVASPVHGASKGSLGLEASVGVVAMDDLDTELAARSVVACAHTLAVSLSGTGNEPVSCIP